MKNVHILALLGGAAALYFVTQKKSNAVRHTTAPTATDIWGQPITHPPATGYTYRKGATNVPGTCHNSQGDQVDMRRCFPNDSASDQLEGYFSTGYFSAGMGATPCCSNCAHGQSCSG